VAVCTDFTLHRIQDECIRAQNKFPAQLGDKLLRRSVDSLNSCFLGRHFSTAAIKLKKKTHHLYRKNKPPHAVAAAIAENN
jgi:hypothetical protein